MTPAFIFSVTYINYFFQVHDSGSKTSSKSYEASKLSSEVIVPPLKLNGMFSPSFPIILIVLIIGYEYLNKLYVLDLDVVAENHIARSCYREPSSRHSS